MASGAEDRQIEITSVMQRGFEAIGRNAAAYLLLALVLAGIPAFLTQYLVLESLRTGDTAEVLSPAYLVGTLVTALSSYLLQAAIVRSSILELSGRGADVGGSLVQALKLLLPMIGLTIISSLAVGLGMLLLIVPGIIIYIMLILSVPVLVEERRGVFGSMSRSADLTKGSRWRIFGLLVLFVLFYFIVSAIVGALSMVALGLSDLTVVSAAFAALVSALTALLVAAMLAALYVELRTVKEGATVETLASIFD
jgi:uncharacterized membrane protein